MNKELQKTLKTELTQIIEANFELHKIQSFTKGIRLGLSTVQSAQNQSLKEILKLLTSELLSVSKRLTNYIENIKTILNEAQVTEDTSVIENDEESKIIENNDITLKLDMDAVNSLRNCITYENSEDIVEDNSNYDNN